MAKQPVKLFSHENGQNLILKPGFSKHYRTRDLTKEFADLAKNATRDKAFEQAFIASKIQLAKNYLKAEQTTLTEFTRLMQARLPTRMDTKLSGSKVGYGMFYTDAYKNAFVTGTDLAYDIICPKNLAGNNGNYLYLTASNRSAKGTEALICYYAHNDLKFQVYDWAREGTPDVWQTNLTYDQLKEYLTSAQTHGNAFQVISIQNSTYQKDNNTWRNEVWLFNYTHDCYDLIYSYEYPASAADQNSATQGFWGPIVEAFQDQYKNLNTIGFLNACMLTSDANKNWDDWVLLKPQDTKIQPLALGFSLDFLDPNHSFAVKA